ncbi:MAG TPA: alpha/beta hydrolase [Thermoanaerobaculia bacterium]|nr:alpha/beta hydrolase [Thermoanaerobaculia bacterium]
MAVANVGSVSLEYSSQGHGEPVLFVHGSFLADSLRPLFEDPYLAGQFHLILYHRRGFAGSSRLAGACSLSDQAQEASSLLAALGHASAHLVAHSYGCLIALQLALQEPGRVLSLTLLETALPPSLLVAAGDEEVASVRFRAYRLYLLGQHEQAVDLSLELAFGTGYRQAISRALPPDAFELAVRDADSYFRGDSEAAAHWVFTPELARWIRCPVLSVVGSRSAPRFVEAHRQVLLPWLPSAVPLEVPGASHLLQLEAPTQVAQAISPFLKRAGTL